MTPSDAPGGSPSPDRPSLLLDLRRSAGAAMRRLVSMGRYPKRAMLVANDIVVLAASLWLSFALRYSELYVPPSLAFALLMAAAPFLGVFTFFQLGLYRMVTRYIGTRTISRIGAAICLSILLWALVVFLSGIQGVPRASLFIYAVLGTAGIWGTRQIAGALLKRVGVEIIVSNDENRLPVIIYGAGPRGLDLAGALERSDRFQPFGFVDKTPSLWGQYIGGYKVYRPDRLPGLVERHGVKEVLLALTDITRLERAAILKDLEKLQIAVRTLPTYSDIATGKVTVSDLRPVDAVDLLGRDPVPPHPELLARTTAGRSVMVTGAGGSIGSELVRQILRQGPRKLVLLDMSENALYEIETEVSGIVQGLPARTDHGRAPVRPEIVSVLGSVLDRSLLDDVLKKHGVETIYHAAAYKHVPIVEREPEAGLVNNTFGTRTLADAAEAANVERVVLISTDKAVRPSSVMGASKRLAEMVLQARAASTKARTVFTMVRFGNVLDSSGSVVRRFRKQIEAGGPVTVTHPQMIRYFMSIPEAASLVIQAGAMARGGELFVLDMGEPVRIDDLARSMIRLMGLEVRDQEHPGGDIAIAYIGLRQGEKLREELLIGDLTSGTEHPRIQKAREPFLPAAELEQHLTELAKAISAGDPAHIRAVLTRAVEGYHQEPAETSGDDEVAVWPPVVSQAVH
jgi:FlaA1/EpsC-like NDP-sugar epimerase